VYNLVSNVIEQLRRIDRANYTNLVRQKEIRRRRKEDYPIPFFTKIVAIYLRSQEIEDALIKAYSNTGDKTLAYSTIQAN